MLAILDGLALHNLHAAFYQKTETREFYKSASVAKEWLGGKLHEEDIAQMVITMFSIELGSRLTARAVYQALAAYRGADGDSSNPHCGDCCITNVAEPSEAASNDDPWDEDLNDIMSSLPVRPSITKEHQDQLHESLSVGLNLRDRQDSFV